MVREKALFLSATAALRLADWVPVLFVCSSNSCLFAVLKGFSPCLKYCLTFTPNSHPASVITKGEVQAGQSLSSVPSDLLWP